MTPSRFILPSNVGAFLVFKVLGTKSGFINRINAQGLNQVLTYQPKRFAGHSHWQNVKSFKESQDLAKSRLIAQYIRAVGKAIRDGNGIRDPKLNQNLASVLADAKANSIPMASLEKALKQDTTTDPYIIEIQAQGGLFILVESTAKAMNLEKQKIAAIVKKFGCSISQSHGNIVKEFFDHIGLVLVAADCNLLPDLDAALMLGIEVGATDVQRSNEGDQVVYQFYCLPHEVEQVQSKLEEHKVQILDAEDVYEPKLTVSVSAEVRDNLDKLYERIRSQHDQVNRIFDNTKLADKN